jgi:hypothetical protein
VVSRVRATARRYSSSIFALVFCASAGLSCHHAGNDADVERAEFGVLFGGDVQDRTSIPLELDSTRQELAIRVTFRRPLETDRLLNWELERPTSKHGPDGGVLYAAELGQIRARAGERRAEAKLSFHPGDPAGEWRVRVRLDRSVILERSFEVTAPPSSAPRKSPP